MYKAILWDVDGTLLNFLKSENAAIKECFQHFGLPECTDEMVGVYSAINEGYWKLLERGVTCDEAEFNALYQRTLGSHIFPNDNGIELVRSLKGRVHQYAVTNGSAVAQERKLSVSGLDKLFDGIFISDKVGAEKPATEFFDRVFEQIPENREDVIIVGDSLTSDIRGANNAGIACCWYSPEPSEPPADLRIDYTITDLNQITEII